MIWKTTTLLSLALCVLGDGHHAISEQQIKIHQEEHRGDHGDLKHIGSNPAEHHEGYAWSNPSYEFSYKVHDPHTHDMKGHEETRHGDEVKGEYWLIQPDGQKRTVTYHGDKHSGFRANVKYSDHHHGKNEHEVDIKHGGEEEGLGTESGQVGEEKDAGEKVHEGEEGRKEEGGRDGEESRSYETYRQAWAVAKKEHGTEEGRTEDGHGGDDRGHDAHHGGNRGRDDYGSMSKLASMGRFGHRDSGRGHDDHHGGNKGRDDYGSMSIIASMGSFGHRHSGRGHGKDHEENRGLEESHKHSQPKGHRSHDTYYYPRFYKQT